MTEIKETELIIPNSRESTKIKESQVLMRYLENVELFHDENKNPFAHIEINGHNEILSVKDREFTRWLTQRYYKNTGKAAGNNAIRDVLLLIEAQACNDGKQYILHNRTCLYDGSIWYDLGNSKAVNITVQGWTIIPNPPILFRKYKHQTPHGDIPPTGNPKNILDFVKIKNEEEKLLFLITLISYYIPDIPHVILVFYGEKGSSKTIICRIIKRLVDPSLVELLTIPKDKNELIQQLSHHYLAPYDNITNLSVWESDVFCRASTGEGGSKRSLYTDDDDFIYKYKRCIALNGINVVATKSDLLDRSVLIGLERIPGYERKPEKIFWEDFGNVKGEILSGIFATTSKAIEIYPTIKLNSLPRMADFTIWGCAIAEAMGYGKDAFLDAYEANIKKQNLVAIENNPVATLIHKFMQNKTKWEGTASELLIELDTVNRSGINTFGLPDTPNSLTREINQIKSNLQDLGIMIEQNRDATQRTIKLMTIHDDRKTISSQENRIVETVHDDNDDNDDIFPLSDNKTKENIDNIIEKGAGNTVITVIPSFSLSVDNDNMKDSIVITSSLEKTQDKKDIEIVNARKVITSLN